MSTSREAAGLQPQQSVTNALFNDNRLKLGVFGLNVSNGCAATTAEGHL
jgi:hypothetical protein